MCSARRFRGTLARYRVSVMTHGRSGTLDARRVGPLHSPPVDPNVGCSCSRWSRDERASSTTPVASSAISAPDGRFEQCLAARKTHTECRSFQESRAGDTPASGAQQLSAGRVAAGHTNGGRLDGTAAVEAVIGAESHGDDRRRAPCPTGLSDHQVADCERALRQTGADHCYVPLLMTAPGVGWVLANGDRWSRSWSSRATCIGRRWAAPNFPDSCYRS
jgi:hypothetical protein